MQRLPRSFQFLLAIYIVLTGSLPTIVQALAFGIHGGVEAEFAAAMIAMIAREVLLIGAVLVLARHPLGILHPILLGVILWPLLVKMPSVIEEFGGWTPVFLGLPVEPPYFIGLGSVSASTTWLAIAKYHALESAALCSTYLGFALWTRHPNLSRRQPVPLNPAAARVVLVVLIALSAAALYAFIDSRGGLSEHLLDLGRGRFRSLAGSGAMVVIADLGTMALILWLAIAPRDSKSPLFILALATVVFNQFVSNGSRGAALIALMLAGLVWALRVQRAPWRIALLLVPFFFLSLGLMNAVRTASWTGGTPGEAVSEIGASEALEKIQKEVQQRRAFSAQVPIVERGLAMAGGPMYGKTYLAALTGPIPRSLWRDKPRGPGSLYAQMFLGEPREGRGIPVGATVETYWNFGVAGLVVTFMLYGMLLRMLYVFFWRRYPDAFAICFYALFTTTFRPSTDDLVSFQQQFVLLIISYVVVRLFAQRSAGLQDYDGFGLRPLAPAPADRGASGTLGPARG